MLFLFFCSFFAFANSNLSTKDLKILIEDKDFEGQVLDVRTLEEWRKTGIIKNAETKNFYDSDFKNFIKNLDKSKKYYVYCHSGGRSSLVLELMASNKINGVNISDGVKGWIKNEYQLVKYNQDLR